MAINIRSHCKLAVKQWFMVNAKSRVKIIHLISLSVLVISGCRRADPIERLMSQVPFEDCASYLYQPVSLPATASPKEVIAALSKRGTFRDQRITDFTILEVRKVHSLQEGATSVFYSAVLMDSNLGRKIVLLQPESLGWYYKTYDAK